MGHCLDQVRNSTIVKTGASPWVQSLRRFPGFWVWGGVFFCGVVGPTSSRIEKTCMKKVLNMWAFISGSWILDQSCSRFKVILVCESSVIMLNRFVCLFVYDPRLRFVNPFRRLML